MDKNRVLFVVDSSNLFYSVRDYYGGEARVDFFKLINYAKGLAPSDRSLFIPVSYLFQRGNGNKSDLIKYLERASYEVVFNVIKDTESFNLDDTAKEMELDIRSRIKSGGFGTVLFATCRVKFHPFLMSLFGDGIDVHVMSFGGLWPVTGSIKNHTLTSDMVFTGK